MNAFYKSFLRDGLGWLRGGGPRVHLAAFGKHPGWDDHMDDLGLDTHSLVTVKRLLYLQGIAGNIATGAWEQLDESARLPGFNHVFRWQRSDQFIVGRIWSSHDGKGRGHFPMIVCAHILGPPGPGLDRIEEVLQTVHHQCIGTAGTEPVRQVAAEALHALRNAPAPADKDARTPPTPPDLGHLPELASFHRGNFRPRNDPPAQVVRVTASPAVPHPSLEIHLAALRERLDADAPVLLLAPIFPGRGWIDVIVGEPEPRDFFCLRSAGLPVTAASQ